MASNVQERTDPIITPERFARIGRALKEESAVPSVAFGEARRRARTTGLERRNLIRYIITQREHGREYAEIGEEVGYSASSVCRIIRKHAPHLTGNVRPRPKPCPACGYDLAQ